MQAITFNTDGGGYWSNVAKAVGIVNIEVSYVNEEKNFGELRVVFDTSDWDVNKDGLIYTDRLFETQLKRFLTAHGLSDDVSYSEQGMQGDNYVSLDIEDKFIATWEAKFGELVAD